MVSALAMLADAGPRHLDHALTVAAASPDDTVAGAFLLQGTLTTIGASDGSATITVTAQDSDGNTVSDTLVDPGRLEANHRAPQ